MFNKTALKRVALSALKAFAGAAIVTLGASKVSDIHSFSDLKALGMAVAVAGFDAVFKSIQIALEGGDG